MNSQKYNKEELYPEDFTEDDKLQFDIYLEQAKQLFPKLAHDEWVLKLGITAYIRQEKTGNFEKASDEEIAKIRSRHTNDTVFYTEPIEKYEVLEENAITEK